jgi:hypothetical protein
MEIDIWKVLRTRVLQQCMMSVTQSLSQWLSQHDHDAERPGNAAGNQLDNLK